MTHTEARTQRRAHTDTHTQHHHFPDLSILNPFRSERHQTEAEIFTSKIQQNHFILIPLSHNLLISLRVHSFTLGLFLSLSVHLFFRLSCYEISPSLSQQKAGPKCPCPAAYMCMWYTVLHTHTHTQQEHSTLRKLSWQKICFLSTDVWRCLCFIWHHKKKTVLGHRVAPRKSKNRQFNIYLGTLSPLRLFDL